MWKLVTIFAFALVFAKLADCTSLYTLDMWGEKKYLYKNKVFYFVMSLVLAVFVGLRIAGNDTYTYRKAYEQTVGNLELIKAIEWKKVSESPGLEAVKIFLKSLNASTQDYLMIMALFTILVYLWFIRKYSCNIFLSIFYFLTMGVYTFSMAAIKQTTAVAILLIATDRAINNKKYRFLFYVLVAELFHPYAFIYLVVPFLFFSPWSSKTKFLLGGTVFVALGMSAFMSGIETLTDTLGYNYVEGSFSGGGVSIFRVAVVWIPVVISYWGRDKLIDNNDKISNLIVNLTMVNAAIMFIGLFGTANYFARLANYFLIFQVLSLPWLFRLIDKSIRGSIVFTSLIGFSMYCFYENVIAHSPFDDQYFFMSISEYIQQLFK